METNLPPFRHFNPFNPFNPLRPAEPATWAAKRPLHHVTTQSESAMPVDLSNVNISLQQFQDISSDKERCDRAKEGNPLHGGDFP